MAPKYPKAGLWRMLKVELLAIADSESDIEANKKMTRAQIIDEIVKVEDVSPPAQMSATEAPGIAGVVVAPALPEEEDVSLAPASARIQRIRQAASK